MRWNFVALANDHTGANRLQMLRHEVLAVKPAVPSTACAWPKMLFTCGPAHFMNNDSQRLLGLQQDHAAQAMERRSHA